MRFFTPEEANAALERVRPLVETLVEQRRELLRVGSALGAVRGTVAGNGGSLDPKSVDFPAQHPESGETVVLCWELGEDSVAYWHGLEDGYAGRKPLPF